MVLCWSTKPCFYGETFCISASLSVSHAAVSQASGPWINRDFLWICSAWCMRHILRPIRLMHQFCACLEQQETRAQLTKKPECCWYIQLMPAWQCCASGNTPSGLDPSLLCLQCQICWIIPTKILAIALWRKVYHPGMIALQETGTLYSHVSLAADFCALSMDLDFYQIGYVDIMNAPCCILRDI